MKGKQDRRRIYAFILKWLPKAQGEELVAQIKKELSK
jgi:hypothetical protein